jgi:hypothetical protein
MPADGKANRLATVGGPIWLYTKGYNLEGLEALRLFIFLTQREAIRVATVGAPIWLYTKSYN